MTVYTKLTAQPGTALTAMPGTALTAMPGTALTAQPGTVLGPVQEGAQAQEGQEAAVVPPAPNAPVALPGKVEASQAPVALESELVATSQAPEGMPEVAGTLPVAMEDPREPIHANEREPPGSEDIRFMLLDPTGEPQHIDEAPAGTLILGDLDCTPQHTTEWWWTWPVPDLEPVAPREWDGVEDLQDLLDVLGLPGFFTTLIIPFSEEPYEIATPLRLGLHTADKRVNFQIIGEQRITMSGGPVPQVIERLVPVLQFRPPDPDVVPPETALNTPGHLLMVHNCANFVIRHLGLDGNRQNWTLEEESTEDGSPVSSANLRVQNCQDFWFEDIRSKNSRGNGFNFSLPVTTNWHKDNFCQRGVIRDCTDDFATDSALAFSTAREMLIIGGHYSFANGGQTCAGLQIEPATVGTVEGTVDDEGNSNEDGLRDTIPDFDEDHVRQSDFIIKDVTFEGNWKGIMLNGRWGSSDVTVTECSIIGGAAKETEAIPAPFPTLSPEGTLLPSVTPDDGLWESRFPEVVIVPPGGNLATSRFCNPTTDDVTGGLRFGVWIAGMERVRIGPSNLFDRWDNTNYPVSAMIFVSGDSGCVWIERNSFHSITHDHDWVCTDETAPKTPGSGTLVPIHISWQVNGAVVIEDNFFRFDVNPFRWNKTWPPDLGLHSYFIYIGQWPENTSPNPTPLFVRDNWSGAAPGEGLPSRLAPQAWFGWEEYPPSPV